MAKAPGRTGRSRRRYLEPGKLLFGKAKRFPVRTGERVGLTPGGEVFPPPPGSWLGTLPEWAIYWAHGQLGLREGQDFVYRQGYFGFGHFTTGGLEVDFLELDTQTGINVQGMFFHYQLGGTRKQHTDRDARSRLAGIGVSVILIDEHDATRSPVFYLQEARMGRDHSLLAWGLA